MGEKLTAAAEEEADRLVREILARATTAERVRFLAARIEGIEERGFRAGRDAAADWLMSPDVQERHWRHASSFVDVAARIRALEPARAPAAVPEKPTP